MQLTILEETRARIERVAKMSGRTPEQVVDDTFRLSEQELLTHMPPERRSGYAVITRQPPAAPQKLHVERRDLVPRK
jgi:hypothetical protein